MIGNIVAAITSSGAPEIGDFESIQTVTVTAAGGATEIDFTSISGAYQHLQIRGTIRSSNAATASAVGFRFNSDSNTNYALHLLFGDGASASAAAVTGATTAGSAFDTGGNATAGQFGVFVLDILDYANTNKNKTTRILSGADLNGSGQIRMASGLWMNTAAITSIRILDLNSSNIAQHSHVALYGIRG